MSFQYKFARPALSVDIVVFGIANNVPSLLVIRRGLPPYENRWALPGGFVHIDEVVEEAARRELREETSMSEVHLEQLAVFSECDRDPRERVITVAFFAMVKSTDFKLQAGTDAQEACWIPLYQNKTKLAFDHGKIVEFARSWLREKIYTEYLALKVLPECFTLTQVQNLYEGILNTKLDKRNFRKQILASGLLRKTNKKLTQVAYRSPLMYTLNEKKLKKVRELSA